MNGCTFTHCGANLKALPSGALWWAEHGILTVSDLHLGKAERSARRGGPILPPYEVTETLQRLDGLLAETRAATVICLGDSFDDLTAADHLPEEARLWLLRLMAGRRWIWIAGNHDAGPTSLGGEHRDELTEGGLTFRHIADPKARAEVSGHYHPKATLHSRGTAITRPCFLCDERRLILPAFGAFTGGLRCTSEVLASIMQPGAIAILTGPNPVRIPMPRIASSRASA